MNAAKLEWIEQLDCDGMPCLVAYSKIKSGDIKARYVISSSQNKLGCFTLGLSDEEIVPDEYLTIDFNSLELAQKECENIENEL